MCISVVLVRGLLAEVERRGFDADELLRRNNIERAHLSDLRHMLSVSEVDLLVRDAMALTSDPALGLSIAEHAPDSMLQVVGHLVLSQGTLREAFASFQRYSELLVEGVSFTLDEAGAQAALRCSAPVASHATRCFMDLALALTLRIGRHFLRADAVPLEVHLQHAAPDYQERYGQLFGCPVRFDREAYALVFPRSSLDVVQAHADQTVRVAAEALAERLLSERVQSLTTAQRVLALIRYERDWNAINVERIARRLGLSVRSLRRRLAVEGETLTGLLDSTRCRIACEELSRPGSCVKEVAELLGFSEPSAFHRAFKRWTGRTPVSYRKLERWTPSSQLMRSA
ncbi:MAG: araC1 [Myxococcaceae bacterium]|nr:araC1 [Myxococcaceae bacterium]